MIDLLQNVLFLRNNNIIINHAYYKYIAQLVFGNYIVRNALYCIEYIIFFDVFTILYDMYFVVFGKSSFNLINSRENNQFKKNEFKKKRRNALYCNFTDGRECELE